MPRRLNSSLSRKFSPIYSAKVWKLCSKSWRKITGKTAFGSNAIYGKNSTQGGFMCLLPSISDVLVWWWKDFSYMWYATKRTISTGDFKSTHTIETNQHRGISFAFFSNTNTAARSPVKWITFYEKLATGSIALCLLNSELNATFIGDPMSCVIVSQGQLERRIIHLLRLDDERARLRFLMSTTSTI